jgi:hypothetical protein
MNEDGSYTLSSKNADLEVGTGDKYQALKDAGWDAWEPPKITGTWSMTEGSSNDWKLEFSAAPSELLMNGECLHLSGAESFRRFVVKSPEESKTE